MKKISKMICLSLLVFTVSCSKESRALKHAETARKLVSNHEYTTAIKEYDDARELLPESQEYKTELSNLYFVMGKESFKAVSDEFKKENTDINNLEIQFNNSISSFNSANALFGNDPSLKGRLDNYKEKLSLYVNNKKGVQDIQIQLKDNQDKLKTLLSDEKLKRMNLFIQRRFDTVDGKGVYEAYSFGQNKKVVLIAAEDKIETSKENNLYVESLGEKEYSLTNSNAFQHYETKEYYSTYELITGDANPQLLSDKIAKLELERSSKNNYEAERDAGLVINKLNEVVNSQTDFNNFKTKVVSLPLELKPEETVSIPNVQPTNQEVSTVAYTEPSAQPVAEVKPVEQSTPAEVKPASTDTYHECGVNPPEEYPEGICKYNTFVQAEKDINDVYNKLFAKLQKPKKKKLTKEELKWISYKDTTCNITGKVYPPKEIKKLDCLYEVTTTRTAVLRKYIDEGYE